ncbi:hypothetical protein NGY2020056_28030 [Vibrio cholerae]
MKLKNSKRALPTGIGTNKAVKKTANITKEKQKLPREIPLVKTSNLKLEK